MRNVLVTRFSALGDVAMTIPVLYGVCRANPDVRFILLTKPPVMQMFLNPPPNLRMEGADVNHSDKGLTGIRRVFNRLRRQYDIDGYADLHDVLRTRFIRLLCRLHSIPVESIDKGRREKRALTRPDHKQMVRLPSSAERYRQVFNRLGLKTELSFRSLYGDGKGDPAQFSDITAPKGQDERWIGVAPFAAHRGKIYPPEKMEEVVRKLSADRRTRLFLFGGGDSEQEILDRWASAYPRTVSLAGKCHGFAKELCLLSHLDVMVSMDSANMHLASIVGVPVVSVWGATHPYCGFTGWMQPDRLCIGRQMECRPCSVFGNKPCRFGSYECLAGIAPEEITDRINKLKK